jgi:two-component system phosphate regulon sensor histidine kinase PhoR
LLARAKKSVAKAAQQAQVEIDADPNLQLRGNATQIESVITNLLSNALRHTPADGAVTLAWKARKNGAELSVADTGEGIAPEHLPRLTERFFRVDRGRARNDGGVGLGLAIVKHILHRHDAELRIRSEVGAGSVFCCVFPKERVLVAAEDAESKERRRA